MLLYVEVVRRQVKGREGGARRWDGGTDSAWQRRIKPDEDEELTTCNLRKIEPQVLRCLGRAFLEALDRRGDT